MTYCSYSTNECITVDETGQSPKNKVKPLKN